MGLLRALSKNDFPISQSWAEAYPDALFQNINSDNYLNFISALKF